MGSPRRDLRRSDSRAVVFDSRYETRFESALGSRIRRCALARYEEIIGEAEGRKAPERSIIPYLAVKHVVNVPWGAHLYAVHKAYDYDPIHLKEYRESAKKYDSFAAYLDKYVHGVNDHAGYLEAIGGSMRLESLKADPILG